MDGELCILAGPKCKKKQTKPLPTLDMHATARGAPIARLRFAVRAVESHVNPSLPRRFLESHDTSE